MRLPLCNDRNNVQTIMSGELSKREGVPFRSFQSEARSFCCFFHRFAQIYDLITIYLLDIGFKWCFMTFFFCFERLLLAMRGCTFSLRGCSRTLKTPNSPPLQTMKIEPTGLHKERRASPRYRKVATCPMSLTQPSPFSPNQSKCYHANAPANSLPFSPHQAFIIPLASQSLPGE